ncbi:MAG: S8 family serine peptidase [Pseudomonadota bacterium]
MLKVFGAAALSLLAATAGAIEATPLDLDQSNIALTDVTEEEAVRGATRVYVIQLKDRPGLSYTGGVDGFAATAPAAGEFYDATASHVQAYTTHLVATHDSKLAAMGASGSKIYSYCHTLNGFAAELTPGQAAAMRRDPSVLSVFEDFSVDVETNDTPTFLGLNDRRAGLNTRQGLLGEDIVIGVLDTGAIQEHPSFSDTRGGELPEVCREEGLSGVVATTCKRIADRMDDVLYDEPEGWNGICQAGEAWSEDDCNNKLIGARWYVDGFLAGRGSVVEGEFLSPRDSSGHGSHTASTAGGNEVTAVIGGTPVANISGMAPRARISVYKVCWLSPGATNFSCFFSDSAAATDAAVADGVDVLNFSVGTAASFTDQQDLAFLDATAAGVFVARSGGNDGPGFATTNAGEPWVTTVAASTADGTLFTNGVQINDPADLAGVYPATQGVITQPLSIAGDLTGNLAAADPILACGDGLANDLTGQIALISRGACGFVEKVENAVNAGAIGILMYTDDRPRTAMGGDATELTQSVPGYMVERDIGEALLAALESEQTASTTFSEGALLEEEREGNIMAGFSSRGPYLVEANWIKPDITAPGVNILAAYTPEQATGGGALYDYLSGTSMSGPHIAGLGALLKEAHPEWTPAQIKSALMTSSRQDVVKEDGETPADPFDFGAGHVDPNLSVNPSLTYNAEVLDYIVASCGTVSPLVDPATCAFIESDPESFGSTDPADLNLPSIGLNAIPGTKTVTRTVTAVDKYRRRQNPNHPDYQKGGGEPGKSVPVLYRAEVEAPEGFSVDVVPSRFYLAPGESATYEVTVTSENATPNEWAFGALTWKTRQGNDVRSPIAVNSVAFITADEVDSEGASGTAQFDITFGYTGEYTAQVHGLNEAGVFLTPPLADDPDDEFAFLLDDPATFFAVYRDVEPGTAFRRWSMDGQFQAAGDDFDMYLYYCPELSCTQIASSAAAGSTESVDVLLPIPFDATIDNPYVLFIHAFDTESVEPTGAFFFDNSFGIVDDAGNLSASAPETAVSGETAPITIEWEGLNVGPGVKYLGAISHSDANGIQNLTIIDIQNDNVVAE